jgi:Fe-S cluster assembly ATP-binding protein
MLEIKNLFVNLFENNSEIIHDFSFDVSSREMHFLIGMNGSGKSSVSLALVGSEKYKISSGKVLVNGKNLLKMSIDERVHNGLFLSYQNPIAIDGLSYSVFLKHSVNSVRVARGLKAFNAPDFFAYVERYCKILSIPNDWLKRNLNVGFSGGEKKKMEMLQMMLLEPKFAILDEPDSGVDIDAINSIIAAVKFCRDEFETAFVIITHYEKLLDKLGADFVHILSDGSIVKTGRIELAKHIQKSGFEKFLKEENIK